MHWMEALMVGMLSGRKNLAWRAEEPDDLEERLLREGRVTEAQAARVHEIRDAVQSFDPGRMPTLSQVLLYTGFIEPAVLAGYWPAARPARADLPLPTAPEYRVILDLEAMGAELAQAGAV